MATSYSLSHGRFDDPKSACLHVAKDASFWSVSHVPGLALLPVQGSHLGISECQRRRDRTRPMQLVTTTFAELTRNLVPRYVGVLAFCNMPTRRTAEALNL